MALLSPHPQRIQLLVELLRERRLHAMVVTHQADIRYLCGFTGSSAALVILAGERSSARLFTDGRYTSQAKQETQGARVHIAKGSALVEACAYARDRGAERVGFDSGHVTVATLAVMRKAFRFKRADQSASSALITAPGMVEGLRQRKDADEVTRMRRAAQITCSLYEGLWTYVQAGMTEREVAGELEHQARLAGADGMSFETIVAAGERSSLPHARATDAPLRPGDLVTLDFGIILDGYCSDMTRTFALSQAGRGSIRAVKRGVRQREVFEAVLEAQVAAVAAVRPGAAAGDVDAAARDVLRRAGLGRYFTHSTGHGVGLEIHERPRIALKSKDALQAGMVITIEPGAYIPGEFGVRVEDTVLVTSDGAEVLTPVHKGWLEL